MSEPLSLVRRASNARISTSFAFLLVGSAAIALSGCGPTTPRASNQESAPTASTPSPLSKGSAPDAQTSRLVLGSSEPGLAFVVPKQLPTAAGPSASNAVAKASFPSATTGPAAAKTFADALVADDVARAFSLLADDEQSRVQSVASFRDQLTRESRWTSARVETTVADSSATSSGRSFVTLRVSQTPGIDEIHGVTGPSALVRLPVQETAGGWQVQWERRQVTQEFVADEGRLRTDVTQWVADRQRSCSVATPSSEYGGGMVGIVGLANALCTSKGPAVVASVGDIYALDDPQPLIDSFGSGSYDWARVVSLRAPAPMDVIAAPVGDRWLIVGVAPLRRSAA